MTLTGCLAELSLPEIFWILEQGHHSGLLTLCTQGESDAHERTLHHIWLNRGRIVAASSGIARSGLLSAIAKRGEIDQPNLLCSSDKPMGDSSKYQGLIEPLQWQQLLQEQAKQAVCAMFQITAGEFKFEPKAPLPCSEISGLPSAGEVTLQGLRELADWKHLEHKLPEPTSALLTVRKIRLELQLDPWEWLVWEFANGKVSLDAIAWQTGLTLQKVQQIVFRLIMVGLAKQVHQGISDLIPMLEGTLPLLERKSYRRPKPSYARVKRLNSFPRRKI